MKKLYVLRDKRVRETVLDLDGVTPITIERVIPVKVPIEIDQSGRLVLKDPPSGNG